MNVKKWLGQKVNYNKDYPKLVKKCKTTKDGSLSWIPVLATLENVSFRYKEHPTVRDIEKAIKQGSIAVMSSKWKDKGSLEAHAFLVADVNKRHVFCINIYGGHRWMTKEKFKEWYLKKPSFEGEQHGPTAFFLTKKEKLTGMKLIKELARRLKNEYL